MMSEFYSVEVSKGGNGWGGPLVITPDEKRRYIMSMTGGGIHPVAQRLAELSGAEAVDGLYNPVSNEDVACAVIDSGGTPRTGLYPKSSIPTVNIMGGGPSGPLADYCTPENYVSGVKPTDVRANELASVSTASASATDAGGSAGPAAPVGEQPPNDPRSSDGSDTSAPKGLAGVLTTIIEKLGHGIGYVVNAFFQGGRDALNMVIRNVLPFMIFISFMIAFITETGFGNLVAVTLEPLTGSIWGLLILGLIIGIPVLAPLLSPGAAIPSVLGIFIGTSIASGTVSPTLALPALLVISIVDTADFIPIAASLGEAEPDTARIAVPAMLVSRFITVPVTVLVGWLFAIGLY